MQIALITPGVQGVATGNKRSAEDYRALLAGLGHCVSVSPTWQPGQEADLLLALHAAKSHPSVARFHAAHPDKPTIVVLTGTDIYPEPGTGALGSMEAASRLVTLQHFALGRIPEHLRPKARAILHSAEPSGFAPGTKSVDPFDICVVGHLRDVKDPLRAALASRRLPAASKIRIRHAGAVLDEKYRPLIESETRENSRYHYLGQLDSVATRALMAESQLTVISSLSEGGARVAGESIVDGTPVLGSRIDGLVGLLGDDYPAYYRVQDTGALSALMEKAEADHAFLDELRARTLSFQPRFAPRIQIDAWKCLIDELAP